METRSAKRKKLYHAKANEEEEERGGGGGGGGGGDGATLTMDRLSDLPDPVLHHILLHLPIKSIAQTSVLSRRWRSLWLSFPDLDFTSVVPVPTFSRNPKTKRSSRNSSSLSMDFITQVLALRGKDSDVRTLRFRSRLSFSRLNALIRNAIRHKVRELDVDVATDDYFNFPRGVINSEHLKVFRLKSRYPGFRLLPSSVMAKGFPCLHTLSLSLVTLEEQPSLLDLFTERSFPRLKKLTLDSCLGMKHLKVSCRALRELTIENCFQLHGLDICCSAMENLSVSTCYDVYSPKSWVKINAPCLRILSWKHNAITSISSLKNLNSLHEAVVAFPLLHQDASLEKFLSVCGFISGLCHAHAITLENHCIEVLSNNKCFLRPFDKLRVLELHTGFNKSNLPGLAMVFASTSTLHTLILRIINDLKVEMKIWSKDIWVPSISKEEQYWESQLQILKPFLHHLKVVKIYGFSDCENEVSLVKFLLKHGSLEEMTLCAADSSNTDLLRRQKVRSQMRGFSWASSNAEITFH